MKLNQKDIMKEISEELSELDTENLREILDFIRFIRVKKVIDTSQAYFWTKKWQQWEKEAEEDKLTGRAIGDGTPEGLIKELKT